jgi:hypothetical protein
MSIRPATLAVLLFAALALPVAGCGGDEEQPAASVTPAATETPASEAELEQEEPEGETEAEREREQEEAGAAGGKDCSALEDDITGEPKRRPPSDVEVLSYAHVYKSEGPFGKTMRYYAALDGTPEDLPSRRDDAQNTLVQNQGYASLSTDQEEGFEAEAHLKGEKHTVDIQVAPLCEGKIRVRYTVR